MSLSPTLSSLPLDLQARIITYLPTLDFITVRHLNTYYNDLTTIHPIFLHTINLLVVANQHELQSMQAIQKRKNLFNGFLLVGEQQLIGVREGSRALHCVHHLRIDDQCSLHNILQLYTHNLLPYIPIVTSAINADTLPTTALHFLRLTKQRCKQLNVRFMSERQDYDISWLLHMNRCVKELTSSNDSSNSPPSMQILSCIGVPIEAAPMVCTMHHLTALQLYTQTFELDRMLNRQHIDYMTAENHSIDLSAIQQLVNLRVLSFRVFESKDRQALDVHALMDALASMSLQMLAISVYPCNTETLQHDLAPLAQPNCQLYQSCQSLQLNLRPMQGNDAGWDVADTCDLQPSDDKLLIEGLKHFRQLQHLAIPFKLLLESQAIIHLQQLQSLTFCQLAHRPAFEQQCQYINDQRAVMGLSTIEHFAEGWPEDKWWNRYTAQMVHDQR